MDLTLIKQLAIPSSSKIVLLVADGLGGLPRETDGRSEMEVARLPNLDALAARSLCGLIDMVGPGIIPGSGPGHLALFGYDPFTYQIGRGVLEACGIDLELRSNDVASRGNFCTLDEEGRVVDRRAGRITTEICRRLCCQLDQIRIEGVDVIVRPVKEHRFVVVFRGERLSDALSDSDPLTIGERPLAVKVTSPGAEQAAALVNKFLDQARGILKDEKPANMILLRGFALPPKLPAFPELLRLRAAAITCYPMYRGLAKLIGMEALPFCMDLDDELKTLSANYNQYDFFYVHFKGTDRAGEDGDFDAKVGALEELDRRIPDFLALQPDVFIVTGDHSTPAVLKGHSWHPVPFLLRSRWSRSAGVIRFTERECAQGPLATMRAVDLIPLAMANALRFKKFGA
ncbi:MAG: 2,3-bisphosphoglycerate-independent phosphoglycerate mutase [candidate division NC10 bacterium]|nr:2,3-bisphosphoglycerate-independent phosphoglycerate mutase [candidate division NC10 bacterium]MDE2322050.1 2,3-bisphosphoglycerate-independent phosphoglycerate mutase [candidate division NC10 bacterium]